jgi:uncharacterized protein YdhG (YjbR/CyaY superfamily)
MGPIPKNIDEYMRTLSPDKRKALQRLRRDIHAAAPGVEECISYQIPAFRLGGRLLVAFGGAVSHCAFYPGSIVRAFEKELQTYDTAKGTIRFHADKPLPASLVRKIVKARIAANAAMSRPAAKRATRRPATQRARRPATGRARRRSVRARTARLRASAARAARRR